MWKPCSFINKGLLFSKVMKEKTTKQQATDGDLPFYFRVKKCVRCGSNLFRVSKNGACYQCSTKKNTKKNHESRSRKYDGSLALSIDDKVEQLRLARELRDYD